MQEINLFYFELLQPQVVGL